MSASTLFTCLCIGVFRRWVSHGTLPHGSVGPIRGSTEATSGKVADRRAQRQSKAAESMVAQVGVGWGETGGAGWCGPYRPNERVRYTRRIEMSAGLTPLIREAWPTVAGRKRPSFSRASVLMPTTLL